MSARSACPSSAPWVVGLLGLALLVMGGLGGAFAQPNIRGGQPGAGPDPNTLVVIGGPVEGSGLRLLTDVAKRVASRQESGPRGELAVRVLPLVGRGGIHDIREVLTQQSGVDMALTHEHLINQLQRSRELGDLKGKLVYVSRLHYEELHLVAGPGIAQLSDLAGKPVNVGEYGSSVEALLRDLFRDLNIPIVEAHVDEAEALDQVRTGAIAATAMLTAKPGAALARLPKDSGLRLLSVPYPTDRGDDYLPATLAAEDYPDLIPAGQSVETVTVRSVLVAFDRPQGSRRYTLMQDFVRLFFPSILEARSGAGSPRGIETGIAEPLAGWRRFRPAERWVQAWQAEFARAQAPPAPAGRRPGPSTPESSGAIADPEMERLFREFLEWRQTRRR